MDQDLQDFISNSSLRLKPIGVIDCIESLDAKEKDIIKKNIQSFKRQIVLTSEDAFSEPAKTWRKWCLFVDLKAPSKRFLEEVYKAKNLIYANEPSFPIQNMSSGFRDSFAEPIKCTRQLLLGHKTPEILSDISYLTILLQSNAIQSTTCIKKLSESLDKYSFIDIVDHELEAQSLWHITELTTKTSPLLNSSSPWTFQWPRSLAKSKKPSYQYS